MNNWIKNIQHLVFPPRCALCGAAGEGGLDLCDSCKNSLPVNHMACSVCALPLPEGSASVCGQCLQQPPPYRRCIAAWRYDPPLDFVVHRLKFRQDLVFARLLGELLSEQLANTYTKESEKPDVIMPVPLHPRRLRERGFNQAVEIARIVARTLDIPLDLRSCTRPKLTQPQAELPADRRKQNVRGAFVFHPHTTYRHIALLDDVMTTGHTVAELTKTIQKVSKSTVDVWVCARASR